jgi:hypothetical protein
MLRHVRGLITSPHAPTAHLDLLEPILIRYSRDGDRAALKRLAALDSRRLGEGTFLLAEVDGELVAAAPLELDGEPLSDPFRPIASALALPAATRTGQHERRG